MVSSHLQAQEVFGSVNVLGGKVFKKQRSFATLSAGVAAVFGMERANYNSVNEHVPAISIGLPVMAQKFFVLNNNVSLGFSGTLNFHRERVGALISANLALGRIRLLTKAKK